MAGFPFAIMASFPFADLLPEIQREVIKQAVPPLIVPCIADLSVPGRTRSAGEHSLLSLKLSCKLINWHIGKLRPAKAIIPRSPNPPRISYWDPVDGNIIFPSPPPVFRFSMKLDTLTKDDDSFWA